MKIILRCECNLKARAHNAIESRIHQWRSQTCGLGGARNSKGKHNRVGGGAPDAGENFKFNTKFSSKIF